MSVGAGFALLRGHTMRRTLALVLLALGASACSAPQPRPDCAYSVRRAVEAQEAVKVCQNMGGCQINLRDVIEVRELIVTAEACQKAKEAGL